MTIRRTFLLLPLSLGLGAGCSDTHTPPGATADLACAPDALRSAWWSGDLSFYGGLARPLVIDEGRGYALVADEFRTAAIRLADGRREDVTASSDVAALAGLRVTAPRLVVDADGRTDLAGATDVLAFGAAAPLASIPWLVPRTEGSTSVVARVGQRSDRVTLLELATGGPAEGDERLFVRRVRVSDAVEERRVELTDVFAPIVPWYFPQLSLLVDEERAVAFVYTGRSEATPRIARVDMMTGEVQAIVPALGLPAPLLGTASVGEPPTILLDLSLSSDGQSLFVTARDGSLRELDAATLEEMGPSRSVGVVVANPDSYLPSLTSPVAVSASGAWLARVDGEGRVVVESAAVPGAATILPSAAPVVREYDGTTGPNPMLVRFLADGVLVVTDAGVERYRCSS